MNENFTWRRLGLLMRNDIVSDYRGILGVTAVLAAVILLTGQVAAGGNNLDPDQYLGWFSGILFIWGTIWASLSFEELHDKTRNSEYLLLPASALDKTLARLLYATVLFIPYLVLFITLASLVTGALSTLLFGRSNPVFIPFEPRIWQPIAHFIVLQSVFFLGAAWFRSKHYIKTALTMAVLSMCLMSFCVLVVRIVFADYFTNWFDTALMVDDGFFQSLYENNRGMLGNLWIGLKLVYFAVVPLLCWYVAWLRVRETQVSHGV